MTVRIGIDLGGTKTEAACLGEDGRILVRQRIATPPDYQASLQSIVALVTALENSLGATASIGVGIPGVVSPDTGLVKNANSTWLIGQPFAHDLSERLSRPVRVMNDANCFAISEASDGAAAGARSVFGVILGTGVGGGIVLDGRILDGPNLIGGEWGHNSMPWMTADEFPGDDCYCGKRGCVETFLSGPAFERDYARRATQDRVSADIVSLAKTGDPIAAESLALYGDRLSRALSMVVNILDPEVIVLGGGMSNLPDLAQIVERGLMRHVFSSQLKTRVVRNMHGDSSGVRGAAWLWPAG